MGNVSVDFRFSIFSLTVLHLFPFLFLCLFPCISRDLSIFCTHLRAFLMPPENSSLIIKKTDYRCHAFELPLLYICILPLQNVLAFKKLKEIIV